MSRKRSGIVQKELDAKVFGQKVRAVRLERKMTIQKLADAIGVQRGFINQLESGDKFPSFTTLVLLLDALKVSADELLYDYLQPDDYKCLQGELARIIETASPKQMKRIIAYAKFEMNYSEED